MIDFAIGFILASALAFAIYHFTAGNKPKVAPVQPPPGLSVTPDLLSQLGSDIIAAVDAIPARLSTDIADLKEKLLSTEASLQAEQQAHAASVAAIAATVAEVTPANPTLGV